MSTDNIWRTRWDLASMEYEITRKDDLKVVSILQSLVALVEKRIGRMGTVEVYTHTLGDDTAFQADLTDEGRKGDLYEFVEKEPQDLDCIYLYIIQRGYDDQGHMVEIPNGTNFVLYVNHASDHHLLDVVLNTDIFAPFYYEKKTSRSLAVAERNLPLLKDFLEGIETTFEGKWDLIDVPAYSDDYFWENGMTTKMANK